MSELQSKAWAALDANREKMVHGIRLGAAERIIEALDEIQAETIARIFHDNYERLAPQFGYETRPETREFDPTSTNGRLMVAVSSLVKSYFVGSASLAKTLLSTGGEPASGSLSSLQTGVRPDK